MTSDPYHKRFIQLLRLGRLCRPLPYGVAEALGARLGRRFSFLRLRRQKVLANLAAGLGLNAAAAEAAFENLCASTGMTTQMVWRLPNLSQPWLEQHIRVHDMAPLLRLQAEGGVVLSHHSFHHNLLASTFKRWGMTTMMVANPPAAFSSLDYLYRFTLFLNAASETNFNGGRILYVDGRREFLKGIQATLAARQVLLVFCDFNEDKAFNPRLPFLHGSLQAPSGVIRQALKAGRPLYFAGFQWTAGVGFELSIHPLETSGTATAADLEETMRRYLAALTEHLHVYPHAWQMWDVFN